MAYDPSASVASILAQFDIRLTAAEGGVTPTPTPTPTLTLSSASPSIASNAAAGTLVSNISNVPSGATPTVTPNDGRLVIAGDASAGWKVVVGMSALSAGTVNFSVAATGATGASGVLTVTAAGSGPTAFTYQTETSNLRTAMAATGTPISTARSRRWDRAVRVMKACGGWDAIGGLHLNAFDTEANFLKNLVSPGTYDLTKVGNPTFVANGDISHTAATDCYRSSATLLDLPQNNHGMGVFSNAAVTGNGIACGARDSGGKGVIIVPRGSVNQALFQSSASGNVTASATAGGTWTGNGWTGFDRDNSASIRTHHESVNQHTALAQTSVAITEAVQLQVLGATGTTSVSSVGVQGFYWLKRAWTAAQARICISIIRDFLDSVRYGEPYIEEIGVGTAAINGYDTVWNGLSLMSICGARAARQMGLTACILGDRQDATISSLGGMVGAGGLNWVDMVAANIAGQYREMLKWLNVDYYGRADTNSQLFASPDARAVNLACRRALDPTRTTGTCWFGMDIPVFMTGGIASVEKTPDPRVTNGQKVTKLVTNDGRSVVGKIYADGCYEGDLVPLIGAPFIFGREQAAASGLENKNGLRNQPGALLLPKNDSTGTTFKINPYVNNDPAQGLLPDMEVLPTGVGGSPDPANQSVNIRMHLTSSSGRYSDTLSQPPRNYNAARYEAHRRLALAITAAGEGSSLAGWLTFNPVGTGNNYDFNAGPNGISSDLPGSGTRLMQALNSTTALRAVGDDIRDYNLGLLYFLRNDPSIPTTVQNTAKNYFFDALYNLDPAPWGMLNFPDRHYQREPTWQMVSDFVLSGNDTAATDGTTPRSIKTIAMGNYREDQHDVRRVAYDDGTGMAIYRQGVNNGTTAGGSDGKNPIPYEIIVPPKSSATNVFIIGASSQTKMAWATNRMEPVMTLQAEAAGYAMFIALRDNVPVQDVDYATATTGLRALMLSSAFIPSTTLPQVN